MRYSVLRASAIAQHGVLRLRSARRRQRTYGSTSQPTTDNRQPTTDNRQPTTDNPIPPMMRLEPFMKKIVLYLLVYCFPVALQAVCDPPILLEVEDVTTTTALLDWVPVGSETSWDIAVLPKGSPPPVVPTLSGVSAHPVLYAGLNPAMEYDFYLRAVCGSTVGNWVKYSGGFLTHSTNPSPCQMGLAIPDQDCVVLPVEVNTSPGTQLGTDVYLKEVRLLIQHPWDADLDISLESPSGQLIVLTSDNGGQQDNYGDVSDASCQTYTAFVNLIEESACSELSVADGEAPFAGTYLPEDPLYGFDDGSNPVGRWKLHLCDDAQDDVGYLLYVELVFAALLCPPPVEPLLVEVDSTFAVLDWTPGSNCANTIVEYGPAGFSPGTGTVVSVSCPPQTISGLLPNTAYDFYLRESCSSGQESSNACPLTVQTICSPPPATLIETFDTQQLCFGLCEDTCYVSGIWRNIRTEEMDWQLGQGATPSANTGPDDDVSGGGQYAYMESSGFCFSTYTAVLESNCIEVVAPSGNCHMSFHYYMYGSGLGRLELLISTDGGVSWNLLWSVLGNQGQQWIKQYIDLSAYDAQTARFRFVAYKGANAQGDIALDEIRFYGSLDAGYPGQLYYFDGDGDGYGDSLQYVQSCSPVPPAGYVPFAGDCDDANADVHPNQPETPCNGIDSNCNGMADENDLPPPWAQGDTICSGDIGLLQAEAAYFGEIYWYDQDTAGTLLHTGEMWTLPDTFFNHTASPLLVNFYVEEVNFLGCASTERRQVTLVVNPLPEIIIAPGQGQSLCAGEAIDLSALVVQDVLLLNPTYTYHSAYPPGALNELPSPVVAPVNASVYYLLAEHESCYYVDSIEVVPLPSPSAHIEGAASYCLGSAQTLVAQDLGNGVAPLTYLWNTGSDLPYLEISATGTAGSTSLYTLEITGANGCQSRDSLEVEIVETITGVSFTTADVSVCGGSDGSIWLSPNGGAPPYHYSWSGPEGAGDTSGIFVDFLLNNLPQGTYYFTVSDSSPESCAFVLPAILLQGPQANVEVASVQQPSCYGETDGCIELVALSGSPSYLWNTGDTTAVLCGLEAGAYEVTISEGACDWVLGPVFVHQPDSLVFKPASTQHVSCYGYSDGGVNLFVSGGVPPYDFLWSNGNQGQNLQNVPAGVYGITITDAAGCQKSLDSIVINQPPSLALEILLQEPLCHGDATGSITVLPQGGSPPYAYLWHDGMQVPQRTGLPAAAYSVTVTDGKGCMQDSLVLLSQPDSLYAQPVQIQHPSCNGVGDGLIEVEAIGGSGGGFFVWSHGGVGALQQNLPQGSYTLTLSDVSGCQAVPQTYTLTAPQAIVVDYDLQPPSCLGHADGAITLQAVQGATPFSLAWNTGDAGLVLSDVPQGDYTVTITDALGCSDTLEFFLEAHQPMTYAFSAFAPNCHDAENGMIFLTAYGGQPPYDYLWSNGSTEQNPSDLPAGSYQCTVTDANGCLLFTDTISLDNHAAISITLEGVDSISCAGASDGGIAVSVTGGVPPYVYTWSNEHTAKDLQNVPAGGYQLTVLDSVQCAVSSEWFVLPEPAALSVQMLVFEQQGDCVVNDVDSLYLLAEGGTGSLTANWNTGYTGFSLAPVPPGDYQAEITDEHGCTALTQEVKVPEERPALTLQELPLPFDTALCEEVQTAGSLEVLIEGGHQPWQYHWSFGLAGISSGDTLYVDSLPQGNYQVTVTDNNGCVAVLDSLTLVFPVPMLLTPDSDSIQHIACKGDSTGSLGVHLTGGLSPYAFYWTDTLGQQVASVQYPHQLPAGVYELLVEDARGCRQTSGPYVLTEPADSLQVQLAVQHNYCYGDSLGWITPEVSGGLPPYELLWTDGSMEQNRFMLPAGWYGFTLSDGAGCVIQQDSVQIDQPDAPLMLTSVDVVHPRCSNSQDGSIDVTIGGGTPPYDFIWSNGSFEEDPDMLAAGVYTAVVADSQSCLLEIPEIELLAPPPLDLDSLINGAHPNASDGAILLTAQGGVPPYDYLWETGDTTAFLDMLPAGFYAFTLTDAHGCTLEQVFEVPLLTSSATAFSDFVLGLSPNPCPGYCELFWSLGDFSAYWWQLRDLQGRLWSELPLENAEGRSLLSLSHLPKGMYIWTLTDGQGRHLMFGKIVLFTH